MPALTARLDSLVPVLFDAIADREPGSLPVAVAVRNLDDDEGELMFRDLEPGPPPARLIELEPDPTWDAVGMMGTGRVWSYAPDSTGERTPVHIVHLVDRTGRGYAKVRGDGVSIDGAPPEGLVVDALYRLLDLPTPPPPMTCPEVARRLWLTMLVDAADRGEDVEAWAARVGGLLAFATWPMLRRVLSAAGQPVFGLRAEAIARHDDGSLARWLLSGLLPPDEALAELEDLLPPVTFHRISSAVGTTAVLP